MNQNSGKPPSSLPAGQGSGGKAVDAFLDKIARTPAVAQAGSRGRLIFALDATLSRQPTWDLALSLQSGMFDAAARSGGLDVQLVYFRGLGECRASRFVTEGKGLAALMQKIECRGGQTQIGKVLKHALSEAREKKVAALVYVGDAMEENPDALAVAAGELGLLGLKAFMFHEGRDPAAASTFREIARLTGGVYASFDASAPGRLAALLAAAAAYASGGRAALEKQGGEASRLLLAQMR
ncbi:MAG: VWA domain-containing protein [Beijerinckiaceae bacterium]|nr:VWA domain-containing protein [Beijerinckiaceae bacterium]